MVEVQDVGLDVVAAEDEVSDDPTVRRDPIGDPERLVERERRRRRVRRRADAADPLRDPGRVARVPPPKDQLDPSEQRPRASRLHDDAVVDGRFDLQVPLDPRDGIDDDRSHGQDSFLGTRRASSGSLS